MRSVQQSGKGLCQINPVGRVAVVMVECVIVSKEGLNFVHKSGFLDGLAAIMQMTVFLPSATTV